MPTTSTDWRYQKALMIKLQVLRYMGILTVMKLSVFAASVISMLCLLAWVVVYCPVGYINSSIVPNNIESNVHSLKSRAEFVETSDSKWGKANNDPDKAMIVETKGNEVKSMSKASDDQGVIPLNKFEDSAFEHLIDQLEDKDISGFEFMAESTNVTIYKKPQGNDGLYQYKLYATIPDATPQEITAVFLDNEYRLVWDSYVTDLHYVKKNTQGPDIIYFNVDYPWPLSNRDYVYAREGRRLMRKSKEYTTLVMHSVLKDEVAKISGVVRVDDYHQSVAMTKFGEHGTRAYIEYYDNPGGSMPSWLVNWAAKTGVPAFLKDLRRACAGIKDFTTKKNKSMLTVPLH